MRDEVHECAALEHRHEARFGAERIPLGIIGKKDQVDVVGTEGASKPVDGKIGMAQASMDEGDRVGWDEAGT